MKDFYESNINTILEIVNPFFAHKAIQMLDTMHVNIDPTCRGISYSLTKMKLNRLVIFNKLEQYKKKWEGS